MPVCLEVWDCKVIDLCDPVGEMGLEFRDGEGGLPPTVDTALLSGLMLRTGEGGLPPTIDPATDSALPPTTDPATEAEPKNTVENKKSLLSVLNFEHVQK